MRKKRNAFFLSALMLLSAPLSAITLDEVCKNSLAQSVTTGEFKQEKSAKALKRPLISSGEFIISKEGIVWKTKKPFSSTMVVSESAIIKISADGKKSMINAEENSVFKGVSSMLSSIFKGDKKALEENFFVSFEDKGESWSAILLPKDKTIKSSVSSITMSGKTAEGDFSTVEIEQANGDKIRYDFFEKVHKEVLSDEERAFFGK